MNESMSNPYYAGEDVTDPDLFFGRESILEDLCRGLDSKEPTPIVLWGPRRIGKSTILYQLKRKLPDFKCVHIDALTKGINTMEELLQEWTKQLSDVTDQIDYESVNEQSFQDHLLPRVLEVLREGKKDLVCLFDELHIINEFKDTEEPIDSHIMRYLYQIKYRHRVRMVFAATWPLSKLSGESMKGERRIRVGNLEFKEAENLIKKPARGRLAYEERTIRKIFDLTGGNPHAIQALCSSIWDLTIKPGAISVITPSNVEEVIKDSDRGPVFVFGTALEIVWKWIDIPSYQALLSFIASKQNDSNSYANLSQGSKEVGVDLWRDWQTAHRKLVELELLKYGPSDDEVRFTNELFRIWVAEAHPWATFQAKLEPGTVDESLRQKFEDYHKKRDREGMVKALNSLKGEVGPFDETVHDLEYALKIYDLFMQARQAHAKGDWPKAIEHWRQMLVERCYDYDGIHVGQLITEAGIFSEERGGLGKVRLKDNLQKLCDDEFSWRRKLRKGKPTEVELELTNQGDCSVWGQVTVWRLGPLVMAPWLDVPKPDFCCLPGEKITIKIKVQPSKWRFYRDFAVWPLIISANLAPPEIESVKEEQ